MAERDLTSIITPAVAFTTQVISTNTTTNGEIVDIADNESIDFALLSGTITDGAYTTVIEQGDESNLSDATTASADDIIGTLIAFADSDDDTVKHVGYVGKKRFARINIVSTGTSSGGTFSGVATLGNPRSAPTS